MPGYGYTAPSYGYIKPPKRTYVNAGSALARAAGGGGRTSAGDPFGLLTDTTSSAQVARRNATPQTPARTVIPGATAPPATVHPPVSGSQDVTPPVAPNAYDINTDPALQQANALIGLNDQQAQAEALKQKKNLLLEYGDPSLAAAVLGAADPTVAAAGANPFSTRASLQTQRDRNLHDLTEGLNKDNLLYSGYRLTQEDQAAHDFQDALAQAAAGVNSNLGNVDSTLAGLLAQSNRDRAGAIQDAYTRHKDEPGATTTDSGGAASGAGGLTGTPDGSFDDLRAALALAAALRTKPVAVL